MPVSRGLSAVGSGATTASADGPCASLPGPAQLACDAAANVAGGVGDAVGSVVFDAADSALSMLASAFAAAGTYFLGRLADALNATTEVDVTSGWFLERYALMFAVSALLTFALLILSVLKSVLRGQGIEAVKSATVYYLAAVVASAFAPAAVYLLVKLSDQLSSVLAVGGEEDVSSFLEDIGLGLGVIAAASPTVSAAVVLIAAVAAVFCAGILWVELLLRTAIIYVSLLFAAPTFSGLVDRSLWKHARRWISFTISVIFAKPIVVAVLSLAAAGAQGGSTSDAYSSVFVSLTLLVVAIFAVGLLFRFVPNAGDEIAGALTARRELNASTPHSPLPGPGVVVRQSVQSHLVKAASVRRVATAPVVPVAAAGLAAHRLASRTAAAPAGAEHGAAPGSAS